jgi:DNA (cytosine-5)-methyltransferase 1
MPSFYEFFAGGGMARAGLGPAWTCLFANDIDSKKASAYKQNWGSKEICVGDVGLLTTGDLPGTADLAWASFPCQDLSLAGMGAGLKGLRSGTFWPFWRLIQSLNSEGRRPSVVVLENVCGALTSHNGADFRSLIEALRVEGYRCGALVVDAALFLPHSRPRLFVLGIRDDIEIDPALVAGAPQEPFHTAGLRTAHAALPRKDRGAWMWWNLAPPPSRDGRFADVIEKVPAGVKWHSPAQTRALLNMMSAVNSAKVEEAKKMKRLMVGSLYKRTRPDENGVRAQRAEVRFDDIAGCLRTPNGGSSRQTIMIVNGSQVKSRLLSARETARLMGLPDTYVLPARYSEAYHVTGDGVAVPVVRHLVQHLIEPLLQNIHLAHLAVEPAA